MLHELDKKTYPSADSWAHSQRNREAAITVSKVVERTFELWGRRRKGKALVFIIDEVGQGERILDHLNYSQAIDLVQVRPLRFSGN